MSRPLRPAFPLQLPRRSDPGVRRHGVVARSVQVMGPVVNFGRHRLDEAAPSGQARKRLGAQRLPVIRVGVDPIGNGIPHSQDSPGAQHAKNLGRRNANIRVVNDQPTHPGHRESGRRAGRGARHVHVAVGIEPQQAQALAALVKVPGDTGYGAHGDGMVATEHQREVACRMTALPGSKVYGYFSLLMQFHFSISEGFDVPPGAFTPKPGVVSHVTRFQPRPPELSPSDYRRFLLVIRAAFRQRRKTLWNNLRSLVQDERHLAACFEVSGVTQSTRPEEVSLDQYLRMSRMLCLNDE